MKTNEQKTREVLKLFGDRVSGEITDEQVDQTLRLLRANGTLDEDVVIALDNSLVQADEQSPRFATFYRQLSLRAARAVGPPTLVGNAAFSASKVAFLIDKNVALAIRCSVEAVEAHAQVQGIPPMSLARSFRNLSRLFPYTDASDLPESEMAFQKILAVAESLKSKGFNAEDVAACVDPLLDSYTHLTSIGLNRSFFSRLRNLAT